MFIFYIQLVSIIFYSELYFGSADKRASSMLLKNLIAYVVGSYLLFTDFLGLPLKYADANDNKIQSAAKRRHISYK